MVYVNSNSDDRVPLRALGERSQLVMSVAEANTFPNQLKIESICLNESETLVYVVTSQGQMIRGALNIEDFASQSTETKFDYVQGSFHKGEITGLDTCIRK